MRNLLNFIIKYHFFFLFLVLQVIAIITLFQDSHYHRSFWISSANKITGGMYQKYTKIEDYLHLRQINEALLQENIALIEQTPYSYLKTDQQIFQKNDTVFKKQYTYINAKVINNSVNRMNNYLTLNKGRLHGIKQDMGVITSKGVIGIVKDVSDNFSSVISLLHMDNRISAKIQKNEHLGTILWDKPNYRKVSMIHIPPHVDIQKGDTIITSGYSKIFPEGILIGEVSDHEIRRGENFITLEVKLFQDFNNLKYVHVAKNLYRQEQEKLEEETRKVTINW